MRLITGLTFSGIIRDNIRDKVFLSSQVVEDLSFFLIKNKNGNCISILPVKMLKMQRLSHAIRYKLLRRYCPLWRT